MNLGPACRPIWRKPSNITKKPATPVMLRRSAISPSASSMETGPQRTVRKRLNGCERLPHRKMCIRDRLKMVGRRKNLLNYLMKNDIERYRAIIAKLGIRK